MGHVLSLKLVLARKILLEIFAIFLSVIHPAFTENVLKMKHPTNVIVIQAGTELAVIPILMNVRRGPRAHRYARIPTVLSNAHAEPATYWPTIAPTASISMNVMEANMHVTIAVIMK